VKRAGQIVLFAFPQSSAQRKLRPALLPGKLPGLYGDWLICMISSQTRHHVPGFDEIVQVDDPDFVPSGLRVSSVIRLGRLAVVEGRVLLGEIGEIGTERLRCIKMHLADWLTTSKAA